MEHLYRDIELSNFLYLYFAHILLQYLGLFIYWIEVINFRAPVGVSTVQPCEVHEIAGKSQGILLTFFCLRNSYSNSFNFYSPFLHISHPFPLSIIIWFLRTAGLSTAFVLFSPSLCSSSQVLLQYVPNSWLFLLVLLCVYIQTYNYLSHLRFANMHLCSWLTTWDLMPYQWCHSWWILIHILSESINYHKQNGSMRFSPRVYDVYSYQ